MAKVITFSRFFPKGHISQGEPTGFVEKFWKGLQEVGYSEPWYFFDEVADLANVISGASYTYAPPKRHTIRAGKRFKHGEYFSPRVWSGKPYDSKQIIIAPDIKIERLYDIVFVQKDEFLSIGGATFHPFGYREMIERLAANDGLTVPQFLSWFKKPFEGQIICWAPVDY